MAMAFWALEQQIRVRQSSPSKLAVRTVGGDEAPARGLVIGPGDHADADRKRMCQIALRR
jgi:hypothetical protein